MEELSLRYALIKNEISTFSTVTAFELIPGWGETCIMYITSKLRLSEVHVLDVSNFHYLRDIIDLPEGPSFLSLPRPHLPPFSLSVCGHTP